MQHSHSRALTPAEAKLSADLRRQAAERRNGYRERALKIYPHVCARCARTFEGKRLKELTVHHKDHNHDHNPADGSNWELLCLYCHDHEHEKGKMKGFEGARDDHAPSASIFSPFGALDQLIKPKNDKPAP